MELKSFPVSEASTSANCYRIYETFPWCESPYIYSCFLLLQLRSFFNSLFWDFMLMGRTVT